MVKCEIYQQGRAFVYEQSGDKKLLACTIGICPYSNGAGEFTSSEDGKKYTMCKTNGIALSDIEKSIADSLTNVIIR